MLTAVETFPDYEEQVRELVQQHRKLKLQQLRLAVYFAPPRRPRRDVFLLEVIEGFGGNEIAPEGKLFEFGYGSTPVFPLAPQASLRMLLTNPTELEEATQQHWKDLEPIRAARKSGRVRVIFADSKGKKLWDLIK